MLFGLWILTGVPGASGAQFVVKIGNFFFNPTNLTINAGDTVEWTNTVSTVHDSTHKPPSGTPLWASGDIFRGDPPFTFNFTNPGVYPYFCQQHAGSNPGQTGTVSVVGMNVPPSASITNPTNGAVFPAPANFTTSATASDSDGTVTNLQILVGSNLVASSNTSPATGAVNNLPPGNYVLTARATDNLGLMSTSAPVNISVIQADEPQIISPQFSGGTFQFDVTTTAGLSYVIQRSSSLSGNWISLQTNVATGNLLHFTDPNPPATQSFFRAFVHP